MDAVTRQVRSFNETGVSAEAAAAVIAKAVTASRPRTRYTIGRDAAMLVRVSRFVSDRALDRIVRLQLGRFAPEASQPSAARTA
jgi:hypothetical protein